MRHDNPHFQWLAAVLAGSQPRALSLLSTAAGNGEALLRVASEETVLAPVSSQLTALQLTPALATDVVDFLAAWRDLNGDRNRQILHELEEIALHLNQIGIQPVVLKGLAYLLTGVYSDPADRFLLDLDLLVPDETSSAAFHSLTTLGYTSEVPEWTALARHYHLPPLIHPHRIRIELHRDLGDGLSSRISAPERVIERSRPCLVGRAVVRVPQPDDLLVHLVVHSQLHHGYNQRIWPPLRAMYDLLLMARHWEGQLDWPAIRQIFQQHRQGILLDLHLLQTAEVLHLPLPYAIRWTPATAFRWFHRRILWRWPSLRHLDPIYMFNSLIAWRLRLLPRLIQSPAGRRHVFASPFRLRFYRNLFAAFQK